ncbi:MAG: penicillin-binding protein 2 [Chlamydiota bacterium]|nr:penicillin-binding protein 2 [Chlamydiota bacterium]
MNDGILLERRLFLLSLALICGFSSLIFVFWFVQVIHGEKYLDLSSNNRIRRVVIPALRGRIFSREGAILVDNRPSFNSVLDWDALKNKKKLEYLAQLLGISIESLREKIRQYKGVPYIPMILMKDVAMPDLIEMEDMKLKIPELSVEVVPIRRYINKNWASQSLGYVGAINEREYEALKTKGYRATDVIGKTGVELYCELYLRGISGGMQVQVDSRGYRDQILRQLNPIPGHDVWLTIDKRLQDIMENQLDGRVAAGVAVNPQTGEILAMVSKPGFDPNIFTQSSAPNSVVNLIHDKSKPLINRATQGEFPPGSPFKLIISIAALSEGLINKNTTFFCKGVYKLGHATFHCWKPSGHGEMDLLHAIQNSCNVYYYNVGQMLGPDRIAKMARAFGFGSKTKLDIGNERDGIVPDLAWKKSELKQSWYGGETLNYAIGQGFLTVTPIQMAMMVSAIANGGSMWRPYLMQRVVSRKERVLIEVEPRLLYRVPVKEDILSIVREGMRRVVQDNRGTGRLSQVKGMQIGGKTGTIQVAKGDEFIKHGWFVAFAPYKDPEIVLVLFVEHVESGGRDIAPISGKILNAYFRTDTDTQKVVEEE